SRRNERAYVAGPRSLSRFQQTATATMPIRSLNGAQANRVTEPQSAASLPECRCAYPRGLDSRSQGVTRRYVKLVRQWTQRPGDAFVCSLRLRTLPSPNPALAHRVAAKIPVLRNN